MKTSSFISLIYGIIVLLSGIMAFRFNNNFILSFIEVFCSLIIIGNVFFLIKEKRFSLYVLLIFSFLLAIFYGYNFSHSYLFFQGLLTAISFFIFVHEILRIFKVFGSE